MPFNATSSLARIWLYSLLDADRGMEALLPYWLQHYMGLGVLLDRICVLVHHDEARYPLQKAGVEGAEVILTAQGVRHR